MSECTWIGFLGYVFAFLFFLLSLFGAILHALEAYRIGKRYGWFFIINENDLLLKNPFYTIITVFIALIGAGYLFIYKIGFVILPNYWQCLMNL